MMFNEERQLVCRNLFAMDGGDVGSRIVDDMETAPGH